MRLPHKTLERKLFASGYRHVIGVDEVGMGCLAGPVVVCAVLFDKKFFKKSHKKLRWLRDSKLLSPQKREKFSSELQKEKWVKFRLAYCFPKTIDRLNIYQAARLAMRRAVKELDSKSRAPNSIALVDGKSQITGLGLPQMAIVKGDRKVFAIACASVIAKVARDKMMANYAKKIPDYGFERHKGYGTKFHQAQLAALGPSKIHRRSFAPVAKML
jgi:ribonuclease HII